MDSSAVPITLEASILPHLFFNFCEFESHAVKDLISFIIPFRDLSPEVDDTPDDGSNDKQINQLCNDHEAAEIIKNSVC